VTLAACLGLRWSELAGLQWRDIDWLGEQLILERAVVKQIEGDVKTAHSCPASAGNGEGVLSLR
jgi:integrase